jgi:hypothetical protein
MSSLSKRATSGPLRSEPNLIGRSLLKHPSLASTPTRRREGITLVPSKSLHLSRQPLLYLRLTGLRTVENGCACWFGRRRIPTEHEGKKLTSGKDVLPLQKSDQRAAAPVRDEPDRRIAPEAPVIGFDPDQVRREGVTSFRANRSISAANLPLTFPCKGCGRWKRIARAGRARRRVPTVGMSLKAESLKAES